MLGVRDLDVGEAVPMLARRLVGVMRMDEAGDHQERLLLLPAGLGGLGGTPTVVEMAQRAEADFVVEVLLHRSS